MTGTLELGEDGKAVKWYELQSFDIRLTPEVVAEAAAAAVDDNGEGDG
ncbi:hypothetical protein [Actinomadura madurae]|nr:hypothetical protein [Actinomadura madurae]MCP9970988.1 hypothetical protein [Actinomadura madurae]MCP9983467.1 hypothetical protein [Actinomadura madurae]